MTMKTKAKKKGTVAPIIPESEAKNYFEPKIVKVATEIHADEPQFVPQYRGSAAVLRAKEAATLPHRATVLVDCGFSIKLQPGWKAVVNALPNWAEKGLIVTAPGLYTEGRVKVMLTNVGKQIIVIAPNDEIANMSAEPIYLFDWITNA